MLDFIHPNIRKLEIIIVRNNGHIVGKELFKSVCKGGFARSVFPNQCVNLSTVEGRFEFVFTPKHASWLNLIESFFSKMTKQMLKGIRVKSKEELVKRIYTYFDEINSEPVVFPWTWHLADIDPDESVNIETLI